MTRTYNAATVAAVMICTAFGIANSAPSFAETATTVSVMSNDQLVTEVPALPPVIAPQPSESPPAAAPVEREKPRSLAELVSRQIMPASLDRDTECLATSVYFEAKGEPLEGQLAVAEVIRNRAASGGRFPSSVCGVVMQKGQFHFVRNGGFPPVVKSGRAWREAVAVARIATEDSWDSRASKALFFHATRVSPGWNKTRVATLGNHVFYR